MGLQSDQYLPGEAEFYSIIQKAVIFLQMRGIFAFPLLLKENKI